MGAKESSNQTFCQRLDSIWADTLKILWQDGHQSIFDAGWLLAHKHQDSTNEYHKYRKEQTIPSVDYNLPGHLLSILLSDEHIKSFPNLLMTQHINLLSNWNLDNYSSLIIIEYFMGGSLLICKQETDICKDVILTVQNY